MTNRDDELAARLRRDAQTWDASPSLATHHRLHAALASPRPHQARRWLLAAAAAAVAIGALTWTSTRPQPPDPTPRHTVHLDAAFEPLQHELVAVSSDARALVDALWQGVRRPLMCMAGR